MQATFRLIDTDEARAWLSNITDLGCVENLPEITEFHPLAISNEGDAIVCAHDTANDDTRHFELPAEFVRAGEDEDGEDELSEEFYDRVGDHLQRLSRAVFN